MPTDTTVNNLVINKLTKAQYDAIQNPSETELYLVPDQIDSIPINGSINPITSGGVYTALSNKANISQIPSNIVTGVSQSYIIWSGTQAEYDAITTKDNNTIYFIKES